MKQFVRSMHGCAQGEIRIYPVDGGIPEGYEEDTSPEAKIVGHSETGHHHVMEGDVKFYKPKNRPKLEAQSITLMIVQSEFADMLHKKAGPDQHETIRFPRGAYELVTDQEYTPQGFRRVQD